MQAITSFSISHDDRMLRQIRQPVYGRLRDAIMTMEFEPGRRLSESELGELFKVSRTPIREALAQLRDDRLVDIVPQYGTFVALITDQAITDAQFVREALECEAVRVAAELVGPKEVADLRSIIRAQERAARAVDEADFHRLDHEFHHALFALSERDLWSFIERADGHLERVRRTSIKPQQSMKAAIARHKRVCDALGLGSPDRAQAALREDLNSVWSAFEDLRGTHPGYFMQP